GSMKSDTCGSQGDILAFSGGRDPKRGFRTRRLAVHRRFAGCRKMVWAAAPATNAKERAFGLRIARRNVRRKTAMYMPASPRQRATSAIASAAIVAGMAAM